MLRTTSTYTRAHRAHHGVVRQPADADQRAEHGRQDQPGDRDAHRVEEALDERVAHRRGLATSRCRGSRSSPDGRGSRSPSGCSSARRWCGSCEYSQPSTGDDDREDRQLEHPAQHADVAPERRATRRRRAGRACRRRPVRTCATCGQSSGQVVVRQRYGGAYIRPPSVHSALTPRSRPSGREVALEDLAVVPDLLDDLVGEVDGQPEARVERRRAAVLAGRPRRRGTA